VKYKKLFADIRKVTTRLVVAVHPSVRPYRTNWFPLGGSAKFLF